MVVAVVVVDTVVWLVPEPMDGGVVVTVVVAGGATSLAALTRWSGV